MKKILTTFIVTLCVLTLSAQKNITKLDITGFNVTLVVDKEFSYEYEKNSPVVQEIKQKLTNGKLTIEAKMKKKYKHEDKCKLTVYISKLEDLKLVNSSLLCESTLKGNQLDMQLDVASSSSLVLDVKNLNLKLNSASKLTAEGTVTNKYEVELSSASQLKITNLQTDKFALKASSAAIADIDVKAKVIEIESSSAATIKAKVKADQLSIESSSGANVTLSGSTKEIKQKAAISSNIDKTNLKIG